MDTFFARTSRFSQRGASTFALAALTASLGLGTAGSVVVYRSVSGPAASTPAAPSTGDSTDDATDEATDEASPEVRFAPCEPPAVLERGVCVTDVVKTVEIPASGDSGAGPADDATQDGDGRAHRGRGDDDSDDDAGDDADDSDHDADDDHGGLVDRDDRDEDGDDRDSRDDAEDHGDDHEDDHDDEDENEVEDD